MDYTRMCENCHTTYKVRRMSQRFCSSKCRSEYHREHERICSCCRHVARNSSDMQVIKFKNTYLGRTRRVCDTCMNFLGSKDEAKELTFEEAVRLLFAGYSLLMQQRLQRISNPDLLGKNDGEDFYKAVSASIDDAAFMLRRYSYVSVLHCDMEKDDVAEVD